MVPQQRQAWRFGAEQPLWAAPLVPASSQKVVFGFGCNPARVKAEGMALEGSTPVRAPASNTKPHGQRSVFRVAAAVCFVGIGALLIWGALQQEPRHNPFETPSFFSWLLTPEPHRGYRTIPVVPLGIRLGLVPRGLCAKPDDCGGLKTTADGQAHFRDDKDIDRIAIRLHRSSTSGQVFALTASGELFTLAEGQSQAWRQVALPAPEGPPAEPVILRHPDNVRVAKFSPDGRKVLTASGDKSARLWDVETGKELRVFVGHAAQISSASFSADGGQILTTSDDKTARVWDAETGEQLHATLTIEGMVNNGSFSADGRRIVTGSADNKVQSLGFGDWKVTDSAERPEQCGKHFVQCRRPTDCGGIALGSAGLGCGPIIVI